jgi:sporulation protein YlmC with PRC-barrel domain
LAGPLYAESEFTEQARGTTFNQNTELQGGNTDEIKSTISRSEFRTGLSRTESADQIIGLPVVAQDGENLGEIEDLKLDTRTGRIDYVVVEKENAMGVGEEVAVAVPLGALQFTDENARLTVDKSKLANVPNPAMMSDQEFQENLNTHYGIAPTWQIERKTIQEERKTLTP